jgi:hypothetical protein
MKIAYKILVGKSEGKRTLGSPKRRWEDKSGAALILYVEIVNWMNLAQERDQ